MKRKRGTVNRKLKTVNREPGTVNREPGTENREQQAVNREPSIVKGKHETEKARLNFDLKLKIEIFTVFGSRFPVSGFPLIVSGFRFTGLGLPLFSLVEIWKRLVRGWPLWRMISQYCNVL